jgi:hypothetical protein
MYRRQLDQLQLDHPDLEIPPVDEEEDTKPAQLEPDHSLWENQSTDDDEVLTTDVKLSEDDEADDSESTNEDEERDQQQEEQQTLPTNRDDTVQQPPAAQPILSPQPQQHQQHPATDPMSTATNPSATRTSVDSPRTSSQHSLGFDFSGMRADIQSPSIAQHSNDVDQ